MEGQNLIQKTSMSSANNHNDIKLQVDFKKVFKKPDAIADVSDVFD